MISLRQSLIAGALAVALELSLLVLLFVLFWQPDSVDSPEEIVDHDAPEEVRPPPEVVLVTPISPPREVLTFLETTPEQEAARPDNPAPFISDRNTRAASEETPALDSGPGLPTVAGRDAPGIELLDSEFRDGPQDGPPQSVATGPIEPSPPGEVAAVDPVPDIPADAVAEVVENIPLVPENPAPEIVTAEPLPELLPIPTDTPELPVPVPQDALPPRPPQPETAQDGGFEPQRVRRSIEGTISPRGVTSLDAEDTPLGRYLKRVSAIIRNNWQRACRDNTNLSHIQPGFIRVAFTIGRDGRVISATAVDVRDAGEVQKLFTIRAVMQSVLPPIPEDVLTVLPDGRLEMTFNFLFL